MIIVTLTGGLSNQMFEYAAARRLALHHQTELKLDLSIYGHQPAHETPRRYELDCFNIQATMARPDELPPPGILATLKSRLQGGRPMAVYTQGFGFDPAILSAPDNTWMQGSWMNPKYFEDVADQIRADFKFKTAPTGKNAELAKLIQGVASVSLHVRRGDYAHDPTTNQNHGLTSFEYYQEAIKQVVARVKQPHFFVISDDPVWCKDNLTIIFTTTYIEHNGPDRGFEDMRLMSLCQHNIIANSSFSWWGAWLNSNPDKLVYAPKRWFTNEAIDSSDFTPPDWVRL